MKKLFVMLCVILSISFTSFASSWYWIGADTTGGQWYVDNENVYTHLLTYQEISSNRYAYQHGMDPLYHVYKIVWIKTDRPDGTSSRQRIKVSRNKKMTILSYVDYDSSENVVDSGTFNFPEETDIIPDSMGEALYDSIF